MVDNAQTVQVQAELDASQTVRGAKDASAELLKLIGNVKELEKATRGILTGATGTLPKELAALSQMLSTVQKLPAQMQQIQRLNRDLSSGGVPASVNAAALRGVQANIRNDPALQQLAVEKDLNKVLNARQEIFRRIRSAMPDAASAQAVSRAYREALGSIGDMPEKATREYDQWLARTKTEARSFESQHTKLIEAELAKRGKEQLRVAKQTNAQELALAKAHAAELNRLFKRDMAGVMTAGTAEQRRAAAGESVNRLRDYAGRQGLTGFNESNYLNQYEDAEARRTARDLSRRPVTRQQMSDDDRAGRAYQQRDAFMNYNGGANRIGSRFQFAGDFAAVGAVMGTAMYAGRSTAELQKELKQLQAITKSTNAEMDTMRGTIFAVGQTTNYATKEIAEAATVMGQAGYSAQQIREALPAIANLATAAGGDLTDTVATVTSVLSIYGLSIERTSNVSNMLAEALNGSKLSFQQLSLGLQYAGNVAADGGVQFEELTAALGAMAQAGIKSGSTLGTGLRALIQELENPSDKFLEWLKSVGLTANDVDVRTQGLAGAITNLTSKSFDSGKAMNVFEIRAASAFSALSNNLDVLEDLQNDMNNTNAATEGAKVQMESLSAQSTRLKNAVTEFTTTAGAPLLAFLQGAIGVLASVVSGMAALGPVAQIITTALATMLAVGVLRWLGALLLGFTGLRTGMAATHIQAMLLQVSAGNLGAAFGAATAGVRAFSVALLATPVGWLTVGITALITVFTLSQAASAAAAKKVEEFRTTANAAAAETAKFSDRVEELSSFMTTLTARSNSMANESAYAGQMAETAAAKFASWGLVLEGNITTVDQLTQALVKLSQEQATSALNQANIELKAKEGERTTIADKGPFRQARRLFNANVDSSFGYGQVVPENVRVLLRQLNDGPLTAQQRDALSGQLTSLINKGTLTGTAQENAKKLVDQLNGEDINNLFRLNSEIDTLNGRIGGLQLRASNESANVQLQGQRVAGTTQDTLEAVSRIKDPADRARASADAQRSFQGQAAYNNNWLMQQAQSILAGDNGDTIRAAYAPRARMANKSVEEIIVAELRRQSGGGFGQVDIQAGNTDTLMDPAAIKARLKSLDLQITDTGSLPNPNERNSRRQALEAQRRTLRERLIAVENPDADPLVRASMMDDANSGNDARSNRSQETSEQRAARDRSNTLKREIKTLTGQIEATSINTAAPAATIGSPSEQRAMKFLMDKGLTAAQAAGIVGNLAHESAGMNTTALGDNGSAYGLAQWRDGRRANLSAFASQRGSQMSDFDTQMEFLWKEMQERGDLGSIQGTTTAAEAAEVFARKFERPQGHDGPLSGMAGWAERLSGANRLAGTGTTSVTANPEVQRLLDQWKSTNIEQIKAEGRASNISDDELKDRLADFEVQAQEYFNDVLSGNAAKMKSLLADDANRRAEGFALFATNALREGGDLDNGMKGIQLGFLSAAQAAMEASDAEFRAKGSEVDPAIAAEAAEKRRAIQADFAGKIATSTLAAIDSFFAGEAERAGNEIERLNLGIERQRVRIATLSNTYGAARLSDVQRYLGDRESEKLDAQQSGVNLQAAQGKSDQANAAVTSLTAARAMSTDDVARAQIDTQLVAAKQHAKEMANELERARDAFHMMTDEAPQFGSFTEALSGSWAVFTDQIENSKGTWETVADGLLNTMNVAKNGFKTLVTDIVTGNKTMGDAFKDFTMSILQSLLDLAAELLAKEALMWVISLIGGAPSFGTSTSANSMAAVSGLGGKLNASQGGPIGMAGGGLVQGPNPNRDSVLINGMPGEVMMSKSAVDMVGRDTLLNLNARANSRLSAMPTMNSATAEPREPDTVNVWVVKEEAMPQMGKRDILATVHEDIMTDGQTRKLIKAVSVGAI